MEEIIDLPNARIGLIMSVHEGSVKLAGPAVCPACEVKLLEEMVKKQEQRRKEYERAVAEFKVKEMKRDEEMFKRLKAIREIRKAMDKKLEERRKGSEMLMAEEEMSKLHEEMAERLKKLTDSHT